MKHIERWLVGTVLISLAACGTSDAGTGGSAAGNSQGGAAGDSQGGAAGNSQGGAGQAGSAGQSSDECLAHKDVDADSACKQYSASQCAFIEKCMSAFPHYASEVECTTRTIVDCKRRVEADGTGMTAAYLVALASMLDNAACRDLVTGALERPEGASCGTDTGTLDNGETCFVNEQCKEGSLCKKGDFCGICTSREKEGGTCAGSGDCVDGLVCVETKCSVAVPLGGTCQSTAECADDLVCDSSKKCTAKLGNGAACSSHDECAFPLICGADSRCKEMSFGAVGADCNPKELFTCDGFTNVLCNPSTNKCENGKTVAVGETCTNASICARGSSCKSGKCTPLAADGAACDRVKGPDCTQPAACLQGKCQIEDPTTCAP